MSERKTIYLKADTEALYKEVPRRKSEYDALFYHFKNESGELYELRFWFGRAGLFEIKMPSGEVLHATTGIEENEDNPFLQYENGELWKWIVKLLKIYEIGITPVVKRYRFVGSDK